MRISTIPCSRQALSASETEEREMPKRRAMSACDSPCSL
jgi:hypothetical protein